MFRWGVEMALLENEGGIVLGNRTAFVEIKLNRVSQVLDFIDTVLEKQGNLVVPLLIGRRTDVDGGLLHTMVQTR
jgi:hypothetical protein